MVIIKKAGMSKEKNHNVQLGTNKLKLKKLNF